MGTRNESSCYEDDSRLRLCTCKLVGLRIRNFGLRVHERQKCEQNTTVCRLDAVLDSALLAWVSVVNLLGLLDCEESEQEGRRD